MPETHRDEHPLLSILEQAAIEELDQTSTELSRLERLLIAAIVEIGRVGTQQQRKAVDAAHVEGLTAREREVLALLVNGHTNKSAAGVLQISARTVEVHRLRLQRKLGVRNTIELVALVTGAAPPAGAPPRARAA